MLGGSRGIGFAYASWLAAARQRLLVVARDEARLAVSAERLRAAGASEVRPIAGNLVDASFRARLLQCASISRLGSIFIGGPSPPAGSAEQISTADVAMAYEICMAYPFDIVEAATAGSHAGGPMSIVFLSSSASREPLTGHPFYLSAIFRRSAEKLLTDLIDRRGGAQLIVLRPTVVWTDLSAAYAARLVLEEPHADPRAALARRFHVASVPDAQTYVEHQSRRLRGIVRPLPLGTRE